MTDDSPLSIGAFARSTGLSVSALRFYDAAGVLTPARVDRVTGYRWYSTDQIHQARLITTLRQGNMPLIEMCAVLAAGHDAARVEHLLDVHTERLEHALRDARYYLGQARKLLAAQRTQATRLTMCRKDLAEALSAVQFAISNDPDLPALNGPLLDYDGSTLRVVASDRYRLAIATVTTRDQDGPVAQAIATRALIDRIPGTASKQIHLAFEQRSLRVDGDQVAVIDATFPDYRRLLRKAGATRISVTPAEAINRLAHGPTRPHRQANGGLLHDISLVVMTDDRFQVLDETAHPEAIGFNRDFLIEALAAGAANELVLTIDAADQLLTITDPTRPGNMNLLMPTLLEKADHSRR